MHIPDGYLSPSTCVGLYAAATPFWYVAMKRARAKLATQAIPLLSVFAAFSFVLMMFNLPLPGGTTGHAVGMGVSSIVLGPWMSIIAVSVALLVQAVFFGDGGISAYGANAFNMAVTGSLVAYAVYRLGSFRSGLSSVRRVLAAGCAGYVGINAAALLAAVEFGIQPLLFHDANGTPLYAPYPLRVSVPAMMIGHLTFAGLAECLITAALVRYLGQVDPALLGAESGVHDFGSTGSRRKLWIALVIAVCLTPLGILAVGKAWGEWGAEDFSDPAGRAAIAAASGNATPPLRAPAGLAKLSSAWRAPLADYELRFVRNSAAAYFICAALGVGVVIALASVVTLFAGRESNEDGGSQIPQIPVTTRRKRANFLEKTIDGLLVSTQEALGAEELAHARGFLQSLDARVKLVGLLALVAASVAVHRLTVLLALFSAGVLLAAFSHISPRLLLRRIWIPVFAFTGLLAVPALFSVPGQAIARIPVTGLSLSLQGLLAALFLLFRAATASTFSLLLVLCTPWNQILRALQFCRVPPTAIVILQMTHRYLFLLVDTAHKMLEARRVRLVGDLQPGERRRLLAASAGVLLDKTLDLAREVHLAMQARGFRGQVFVLETPQIQTRDRVLLAGFVSLAGLSLWVGQ